MNDDEIRRRTNFWKPQPAPDPGTADGEEPGPTALVFDDEPIETVLYGQPGPGPTIAESFPGMQKRLERLKSLALQGALNEVIRELRELPADSRQLSLGTCRALTALLSLFIPCVPCPVLRHNPKGLEALLESICAVLSTYDDADALEHAATLLFRCYEHLGDFERARRILQDKTDRHAGNGNRRGLAVDLNNLGFEYLLEGRWRDAMPHFERAASLAAEEGDSGEAAIMRSNYWTCRVELDGVAGCEGLEAEAGALRKVLESGRDWRVRKLLILQARIEEHRGNLDAAAGLAERAVKVASKSGTRWPEMDHAYLERLRATRGKVIGLAV